MHVSNLTNQEAEAGKFRVGGSLGYMTLERTCRAGKKKKGKKDV